MYNTARNMMLAVDTSGRQWPVGVRIITGLACLALLVWAYWTVNYKR